MNPSEIQLQPGERLAHHNGPKGRLSLSCADRRVQALELRKAGLTYRSIGERLGVGPKQAWKDVDRALKDMLQEPAESVRAMELARLDEVWHKCWDKVDKDPRYVESLIRISERRARLLGLDAPVKVDKRTVVYQARKSLARVFRDNPKALEALRELDRQSRTGGALPGGVGGGSESGEVVVSPSPGAAE